MSVERPRIVDVVVPYLERDVVCGVMYRDDLLRAWADEGAERLVAGLVGGVDLHAVLVDILAARYLERAHCSQALDALLDRVGRDAVTVPFPGTTVTEQWLLARHAMEAVHAIIAARHGFDAYGAAIIERLARDVDLGELMRAAVVGLPKRAAPPAARRLAEVALDPANPAATRFSAFDALRWGASKGRSACAVELERVTVALVHLVTDEHADARLRRMVIAELDSIAPERVHELQRAGAVDVAELPDAEALSTHGVPNLPAIVEAAVHQSTAGVLAELRGESPERILVASWLAPEVAGRQDRDWESLAEVIVDLVDDKRTVQLESRELRLRDAARSALGRLLGDPLGREDAAAQALAVRALRRQLTAVSDEIGAFDRPWVGRCDATAALLTQVARDPDARLAVRWAAVRAHPYGEPLSSLRGELLLDEDERPGLRALAGLSAQADLADVLDEWVDRRTRPWVLLDGAPVLPIAEPRESVPIEWLSAAIIAAEDVGTVALAVMGLALRLRPESRAGLEGARDAFRELADDALLSALRRACTGSELATTRTTSPGGDRAGGAAWAAQLLAYVGDPGDADAIGFGAAHDLWFHEPYDHDWTPVQTTVGGISPDAVGATPLYSALQPFVEIGFDPSHHQRVWARAYAWLARRHELAGREEQARACWEQALRLDPDDLDAVRKSR